jgi:hypothetical protein
MIGDDFKTNGMNRSTFVNISAGFLIAVFTYAAISKLLDFHNFHRQLFLSPLLNRYAGFISWFIPMLELLIVWMLISVRFRLLGFYLAFSQMLLFTLYIFYILNFSAEIPCSCGGLLQYMGWNVHLIFNIVLLLLAATSILIQPGNDALVNLTKTV